MSRWLWTAELWTPVAVSGPEYISRAIRAGFCLPYGIQDGLVFLGSRGVAELSQGLGFDLADPLAGHVEGAADLFQGVLGAVPDPEPHLENLLLARRQGLQDPAGLVLEVGDQDRLDGREDPAVLDE